MEQYVEELKPISFLSKNFLDELNYFFINSSLSKSERQKLVEIIKTNLITLVSK
jgi:hypothetical protein